MKLLDQDLRLECHRRPHHRRCRCLRPGSLCVALLASVLCGPIAPGSAQAPTSDDGFGAEVLGSPRTNHTVLADGGILVGGDFLLVDGETTGRIVRLGADGVLDESFDPAPDNIVEVMLEQPDGMILVGGRFTTIAGQPRSRLARLNPDGSLDTAFQAEATSSGALDVRDLALQPDGKILVVGNFEALAGEPADSVGRLLPDGTFDPDFDPPDDLSNVEQVVVDRFGRILIGGGFFFPAPVRSLARLNRDGSIDTSFEPGVLTPVDALAIQADGSILVGGFGVNPQSGGQIARFAEDGTQDVAFDPDLDDRVEVLEVQADGRILVGGDFEEVEGQERLLAARLLLDGSLDSSFVANRGGLGGVQPNTITELADGRILIAGSGGLRRLHPDGTVDETLENGVDSFIQALAIQADGRIVVGGDFEQMAGTARVGIGRLFPDGFLDTGFVASIESATFSNEQVHALVAQADGNVVVGGEFDTLSGSGRNNLGRVHADGTLDTGFAPLGADGPVRALALEPDGDVLVGGSFDQLGGVARSSLGRLASDGSVDATFAAAVDGPVSALAAQPDGMILVGGEFTSIEGELRQNLARLHADGSVDANFDPHPDDRVEAIVLQPDGRILVSGFFQSIAGGSRDFVARLDSDGTLDETFDAGTIAPPSSRINALALQHDGRILFGGSSTTVGGETRWGIGRLHPDGAIDEDFDLGFLTGLFVAPGQVLALALQPDDKILVAGGFTAVDGVERDSLVRLRDAPPSEPRLEVRSDGVTWLRDGGPELDRVELELSTDGSAWSPVGEMSRVGTTGDWEFDVVPPPGVLGSYRARGVHGPGSGSILESGRVFWIRPDTDGDGLPDDHEFFYGLDPEDPDDAVLDPDGDGLTSLEELQIDPWLDPQDPDTDNDGIDDRLDRDPIVADNACAAAGSADVSFTEVVTGVVNCGATASIVAMPPAEIETQGDLLLIAPRVAFEAGFRVGGRLRVQSVHPCAACP